MATSVDPDARVDSWLLPGELARSVEAEPVDHGRPARRTARDWVVDTTLFLLAAAVWAGEVQAFVATLPIPGWLAVADLVTGALLCVALWWRRRFPVALGLAAALAGAYSNTAAGAVVVAFFSLALHRGWRWALPIVLGAIALATPYIWLVFPTDELTSLVWLVIISLLLLLATTAGLAVRARRQVVLALRARADAAAREEELRLDRARQAERDRIAREMHDVLAHRLSLLAVHAGALEYRLSQVAAGAAAPPTEEELAESVGIVRRGARLALEELRGVLHVLRGDDDGTAPPQPTLAAVPALVAEATASGQRVRLALDAGDDVPEAVQRTVYRVVQEGLTNARKHAPGAQARVGVTTTAREAVVEVTNPVPLGVTSSELAGARSGLHGLAERARLHRDGERTGAVTFGITDGTFRLVARIPWSP